MLAQGEKVDIPEQAQEPVIDAAEDARHGGDAGDGRGALWLWSREEQVMDDGRWSESVGILAAGSIR